jgi:HPt (histidine-containing phosphotransfer) domain-containing protein
VTENENRAADPEAAIDWAVLNGIREFQAEGEPDLVQELISLFRRETPPLLEAIRAAIGEGDAVKLRKAAHSLKGQSANLGLRRVAALSAEIEKKGMNGTVEGAAALLTQLEAAYEWACRALEAGQGGPA